MLRTIHTMEELDISGWMEVYREGHEENGAYFYPDEPPERALHLAEEDSRAVFGGLFPNTGCAILDLGGRGTLCFVSPAEAGPGWTPAGGSGDST